MAGNLMPDAAAKKSSSHYRDTSKNHYMIQWPQLKNFLIDTQNMNKDSLWWGYFYHLYVDCCFFKNFFPNLAAFYDKHHQITQIKEEISYIKIRKTGEEVSRDAFFSDDYYYGDFTAMNRSLMENYHLVIPCCPNGGKRKIAEVSVYQIQQVIRELKRYASVTFMNAGELKVFKESSLLDFLEKISVEFEECYVRSFFTEKGEHYEKK